MKTWNRDDARGRREKEEQDQSAVAVHLVTSRKGREGKA